MRRAADVCIADDYPRAVDRDAKSDQMRRIEDAQIRNSNREELPNLSAALQQTPPSSLAQRDFDCRKTVDLRRQ